VIQFTPYICNLLLLLLLGGLRAGTTSTLPKSVVRLATSMHLTLQRRCDKLGTSFYVWNITTWEIVCVGEAGISKKNACVKLWAQLLYFAD